MKKLLLILICSTCLAVSPTINSFNAGQVTRLMEPRTSFEKYQSSNRTIENMLIKVHGPVVRRPGTFYVATAESRGVGVLTNFFLGLVRTPLSDGDIVFKYISSDGALSGTWAGDGGWGTGVGTSFFKCADIFHDSEKNSYVGFVGSGVGATGDVVAKLDADGVLVTSWGNSGFVGSAPAPQPGLVFRALTVDDDDNLYVARTGSGSGLRSVLVKYDSNGDVVTDFGDNGAIIWDPGNRRINLQVNKLVIQGDNIYICGDPTSFSGFYNICAFNKTTGAVDTTWATNGYSRTLDNGNNSEASSISFDGDGKLYVHVFDATNQGSLYRLNVDGSVDATFNQKFFDVVAPIPVAQGSSAGYDSQIDKDGNIWAFYNMAGSFIYRLKKFNPAGDELVSIEIDGGSRNAFCMYTEDNFVYLGATDNWGGFNSITRYSLAGVRDTGFGISLGGTVSPVVMKPSGDTISSGSGEPSLDPIRLIPFEYSTDDSYVLELGNSYIRFYMDDGT